MTEINAETIPADIAEEWSAAHEGTTPADAPTLLVRDEDEPGVWVCDCCAVEFACAHPDPIWLSGEPGVVVTLNGPIAARCPDCGMTATLDED
jgi:hypothetical protein